MILIKHGTVHFPGGEIRKDLDILIDGAKIARVAAEISVGAEVIDACGMEVFPGFILPATQVGIYDYADMKHCDSNEISSPVNADLRVRYALDPVEVKLQGYENHGITSFGAVPGNGALAAGRAAVFHTFGRTAEEMLVAEDVALKVNFLPDVKETFLPRNIRPSTRMGMAALLRAEFQKAGRKKETDAPFDPSGDVFRAVLRGELPILCSARESFDLETMLALQEEFGFRLIFLGAYQAPAAAEKIRSSKTSVLIGSLIDCSYTALYRADIPALLELSKSVPMAFGTNGSGYESLLWSAEKAVRNGLDPNAAVDMLTIKTAEILGVSDKIGSIEAGKYADISIWNEHPLKTYEAHIAVCITAGRVWRAEQ